MSVLGFTDAAGGDGVFRALVLARIIEPVSKLDSLRVLGEVGVPAPSYSTVKRRLAGYAKPEFRKALGQSPGTGRLKGYHTNLPDPDPEFVIGAYHHLFHVEDAFRMTKSDLAARPMPADLAALLGRITASAVH